ncbi:hypothetical protein BHU24_02940 [Bacillus pseudomycoides]|uniref:hypothetical protein n=1 Tax=Bacillus pseudomycoides TaxID=64104 RepID=UPI000BF4CBE8|nr:hypothetical protein [Bacillus pseudomycoides]MBD5795120.1 hypothetical protein [Bacillus pseudomycoides]MED1473088.1 hypothetical protein [Bacillus pseudomycoides]PEO86591.1 hypothetical protein CN571_18070 [Bacillus pseudomycoides]
MFRKKTTICRSCGKEIQTYEKTWIHMPFPPSGMTNMKKYIELDGEVYCGSCVGVFTKQNNEVK